VLFPGSINWSSREGGVSELAYGAKVVSFAPGRGHWIPRSVRTRRSYRNGCSWVSMRAAVQWFLVSTDWICTSAPISTHIFNAVFYVPY